jgi:alpha-tubulin suppressor-like RCC1 family protein
MPGASRLPLPVPRSSPSRGLAVETMRPAMTRRATAARPTGPRAVDGSSSDGSTVVDGGRDAELSSACVTGISAGSAQTCARRGNAKVSCWGNNNLALLGTGTLTGQACGAGTCIPSPVEATALGADVVEMRSGNAHSCARKSDGTVFCWGTNGGGQLGDGTLAERNVPKLVDGLGSVTRVAGGGAHTCARKSDGTLWCWGDNSHGQLGNGTIMGSSACSDTKLACESRPVQVTTLGGAVDDVSAGFWNTCALKSDHTVWCWGFNLYGQVGDGTVGSSACGDGNNWCHPAPAQVTALGTDATEISVGRMHACARKKDGTLWCWGFNGAGQLGIGAALATDACANALPACKTAPAQVTTLGNDVVTVSASSGFHTCAVKTDNSVWCWGENVYGQLGDGTYTQRSLPVSLADPPSPAIAVSTGDEHTCILHTNGTASCLGRNQSGELGNGTTTGDSCANDASTCVAKAALVTGLCP